MLSILPLAFASIVFAQDEARAPTISETADRAVSLITDAEWDAARALLEQEIQQLGTTKEQVSPQDLATLWQALAAAGVWSGEIDGVGTAMEQACAVAPGMFNERLGTRVEGHWRQACTELEVKQQASLEVLGLPEGCTLWVDGIEQQNAALQLPPGQHLVQAFLGGQEPFVTLVNLTPGQHQSLATGLVAAAAPEQDTGSSSGPEQPDVALVAPADEQVFIPEPVPAHSRRLARPLLLGGTTLAVGTAAGLAIVGAQRLQVASTARQTCSAPGASCTEYTEDATTSIEREGKGFLAGAGVSTALALGLGVTLVIHW